MTILEKAALASLPLSYATVESFYDGSRSGTAEQCLKALCVSHERQRMDQEGLETLRVEDQRRLTAAQEIADQLADALRNLLRDTGQGVFAQGPSAVKQAEAALASVEQWKQS